MLFQCNLGSLDNCVSGWNVDLLWHTALMPATQSKAAGLDGSACHHLLFVSQPGEVEGGLTLPENYCGSCFGAKEGCCNTCREVTEAYMTRGWSVHDIRQTSEQVRLT